MNRRIAIAMILCLTTMGAMPVEAPVPVAKSDYYIIGFSATWCGPCQKMKRQVWPNKRIKDLVSQYGGEKVYWQDSDTPADKRNFRKYGVYSLPTIIIINSEGKAIKRARGYMSVAQLESFLSATPRMAADGKETVTTFGVITIIKWMIINFARLLFLFLG